MNEYGGKYKIGDKVILVENTKTDFKKVHIYTLGELLTITSIIKIIPNSNSRSTSFYEVNGNSKLSQTYYPLVEEQLIHYIDYTSDEIKTILKSYDFKSCRLAIKKQLEIYKDEY